MSTVTDIDKGFKRIKAELKLMSGSFTKVGVQAGTRRRAEKGTAPAMVVIAVANEFGVPEKKIPSRPAMRLAFDKNIGAIKKMMESEKSKIYAGASTTRRSLNLIGQWYVGKVKDSINSNIPPGNAPSTAREKIRRSHVAMGKVQIAANVKTLIDTGQYRNSIRNVEVMKGGG